MVKGHSKNPGYIAGDHWVECARCGFDYRQSHMKREWTGVIVCQECWEPRHPQDFVRATEDDQAAKGLVNPQSTENYIGCSTSTDIAGEAVAGCAIPGFNDRIPAGTFTL